MKAIGTINYKRILKDIINDLDRLEELEKENAKLKKVIDTIKECIPIEFYHLKQSKYYTLNIRGALIDVSKEKYYELQEGLD